MSIPTPLSPQVNAALEFIPQRITSTPKIQPAKLQPPTPASIVSELYHPLQLTCTSLQHFEEVQQSNKQHSN